MESNYLAGLVRFETWKMKFEAEAAEEMVQKVLRVLVATAPPQILLRMQQQDPETFKDMMKIVKGEM